MPFEWTDLNPFTWPGQVKSRLKKDFGPSQDQQHLREEQRKQADAASNFAGQGEQGFAQLGAEAAQSRDFLRRLASGEESLSREQLRQGLQQGLAAQRSMAASASPQNSVMAARNAAMNMGRMSMGMSGQAAMAGIAERQAAQQALAQMLMQQRQQELQAALGSRQNANAALGMYKPEPSTMEKASGPLASLFSVLALSDRRAKTDIEDGDNKADRVLKGIKAFSYKYKNERDGKGEQFGIMAQDLERAGLKHAVIDTPNGKYVDGAKAATASLGLIAALGKKVAKLEGAIDTKPKGPAERASSRAALRAMLTKPKGRVV